MLMDLRNTIQPHELSHLDNPFTEEEVTNVIVAPCLYIKVEFLCICAIPWTSR
jgi:hypothetical protein